VDEREALFALYAGPLRTDGKTDFRQLARLSSGLSPASIANGINAAAMMAAKEDAAAVTQAHFQRALEQHLMGGPASGAHWAMSASDRQRIAVHEAGHALVAKLLKVGVVEKVSILKRGRALGVTLVTSDEDAMLQSEPELTARMTMLLGGRSAEALVLQTASTGAANDLERVSNLAYRMVTEFGFSKDIGPLLVNNCSKCHGATRQKNDLRLDSAEAVQKGGKNGPVFVAGKPEESPIFVRTTKPPGDADRMPAQGTLLTKKQTDMIKAWIAGGAKFD